MGLLGIINRIVGFILGLALACGALWLRLSHHASEMLFSYILRSESSDSDYRIGYAIAGAFVGMLFVTIVIFLSSRYNRRRKARGLTSSEPVWIMVAVCLIPFIGSIVYAHSYG